MRVFISIVIGDFLHNFVDGIFIGTAFLLCDNSTVSLTVNIFCSISCFQGWAIALTTAVHELAQGILNCGIECDTLFSELADYRLLVQEVGLTPFRALAVNFCAGLSVVIGTMVGSVTRLRMIISL